jgi:hypothetical protein
MFGVSHDLKFPWHLASIQSNHSWALLTCYVDKGQIMVTNGHFNYTHITFLEIHICTFRLVYTCAHAYVCVYHIDLLFHLHGGRAYFSTSKLSFCNFYFVMVCFSFEGYRAWWSEYRCIFLAYQMLFQSVWSPQNDVHGIALRLFWAVSQKKTSLMKI